MTSEKVMTPGTMAWQGDIDYAKGFVDGTNTWGWITSHDNSRVSQLDAGRLYQRLNLTATKLGVAMHPVSQLLQEYPELDSLYEEFRNLAGVNGTQTVQMLFRLGYAGEVSPSPRRPLQQSIVDQKV